MANEQDKDNDMQENKRIRVEKVLLLQVLLCIIMYYRSFIYLA